MQLRMDDQNTSNFIITYTPDIRQQKLHPSQKAIHPLLDYTSRYTTTFGNNESMKDVKASYMAQKLPATFQSIQLTLPKL